MLKNLLDLIQKKKYLTDKIINIKNEYLEIDKKFEQEMETQRKRIGKRFQLCGCLKT